MLCISGQKMRFGVFGVRVSSSLFSTIAIMILSLNCSLDEEKNTTASPFFSLIGNKLSN